MMYYQNNSFLRPSDRDYGYKTLLNTERKALEYAIDRSEGVWVTKLGAGNGHYAGQTIHNDTYSSTNMYSPTVRSVNRNSIGVES
jgi:surface antigen